MNDSHDTAAMTDAMAGVIERLSYSMDAHERSVLERSRLSALSSTQIHYLDMVRHMGSPRVGDLAHELRVSKPTATVMVNELVNRGYLEKTQSESDRRSVLVTLTRQGTAVSDLHDSVHRGYALQIVQALGDRQARVLQELLDQALERIERRQDEGGDERVD